MGLPAFSSSSLENRLSMLDNPHQLAFGAACCERMLPNYVAFQKDTGWGDVTPIRDALDAIWSHLVGDLVDFQNVKRFIKSCEVVAPSSDNFESLYVTAAQDACFAVCSLLDFVEVGGVNKIVQAATYATDSIDLYVQEIEGMDPNDPGLEQQIRDHRFMQRELEQQERDLEAIEEAAIINPSFLEKLKNSWKNDGRSNLDLS